MRKYFLLSAVALMISGTANAGTDYADMTVSGDVLVATEIECDDLNLGTIVIKKDNAPIAISYMPGDYSVIHGNEDIISISYPDDASCANVDEREMRGNGYIEALNTNVEVWTNDAGQIYATLEIPQNLNQYHPNGTHFTAPVTLSVVY